jgi:hypothetical protein
VVLTKMKFDELAGICFGETMMLLTRAQSFESQVTSSLGTEPVRLCARRATACACTHA